MKTRTISQCFTKCYCSYVTYVVAVKTEWKRQKWIHIKSISMHACTYIVHIHKCTYALRKCLSHMYRSKWRNESIMWHNCKHAACSSKWMQHNCVVSVVGGCSKPISFQQHTCYSFGLILLGFFFFFNLRGGKVPLLSPGWFHCLWLNTPTNKMLTLEAT